MKFVTIIAILCYLQDSLGHTKEPECGIKGVPNSDGYGRYPWYAGVFRKHDDKYQAICGGTIIGPDMILTAAHCVADFTGEVFKVSDFVISAGKILSNYDVQEKYQQLVKVTEIMVPEYYTGADGKYEYDIAVIKVDPPFKFNNEVSPVCIGSKNPQYNIQPKQLGTIAGWASNKDGGLMENLQEMQMPFLSKKECREIFQNSEPKFLKYVSPDKLCLNSTDGVRPTIGTGGSGYIFEFDGKNYIQGIVSVHIKTIEVPLLTNVTFHIDWIPHSKTHHHQ